jgi:hypothetical protein
MRRTRVWSARSCTSSSARGLVGSPVAPEGSWGAAPGHRKPKATRAAFVAIVTLASGDRASRDG